jgi:hypothetical protein
VGIVREGQREASKHRGGEAMMGLVMLAILAAAPVHAERWTLWAHGTDPSGAEEWQRAQGAAIEAECWAIFDRLQLTGVDSDVVRTVVEGHKTI